MSDGLKPEGPDHVFAQLLLHVANEASVLAQMEQYTRLKAAKLWQEDQEEYFSKKLDRVVEHLGGPPRFIVIGESEIPPPQDTYPEAVLREMLYSYWRAQKSVQRAHAFMVGARMIKESPGLFEVSPNNENHDAFRRLSESTFWELAETAYIRLSSYWDRAGQVLDFAFFRIRQFERDGFAAVMDRIHVNIRPMNSKLSSSPAWVALRNHQTSGKDDGLKWLLRRRNLIVHSIHLRPAEDRIDRGAFESVYNHLEENLAAKLSPRSLEGEVNQLHSHLDKASLLFPSILSVLMCSAKDARQ